MADGQVRFSGQIAWDRFRLDFSGRTLVMGILNVTPDSFSDGGLFFSIESAVTQALRMVREGADIIDIGGESTRPGSAPVPVDEQIRRVVPVIETIARQIDIPISIDTTHRPVAEGALDVGASIINDISALQFDPGLADLAARTKVPVILMHMQGTPATMQTDPHYDDVIREIKDFLRERMAFATQHGIEESKLILDPGIGFGKRLEDNLKILAQIEAFYDLGRPVLVGHSRKAFLGKLTGRPAPDRDTPTLAVSAVLAERKVHLLRVHDVRATREACDILHKLS